jgi:tRNA(Ile2) C34 agmatinyltransferase TiaS
MEFKKHLAEDPVFVRMVRKLIGFNLVCSCKPLPCHGDVIKEYLDSVQNAAGGACTRCGAEVQLAGIDIYICPWCGKEIDVCEEEGL